VITVRTEVLEVKDKSLRFAHEMRRDEDGEIAATTILVGVHLDTMLRRACAFPDALRNAAQQWLSAEPSRWAERHRPCRCVSVRARRSVTGSTAACPCAYRLSSARW